MFVTEITTPAFFKHVVVVICITFIFHITEFIDMVYGKTVLQVSGLYYMSFFCVCVRVVVFLGEWIM